MTDDKERRDYIERRVGTPLNANPPYLTKKGTVLYDRRCGLQRRKTVPTERVKHIASS